MFSNYIIHQLRTLTQFFCRDKTLMKSSCYSTSLINSSSHHPFQIVNQKSSIFEPLLYLLSLPSAKAKKHKNYKTKAFCPVLEKHFLNFNFVLLPYEKELQFIFINEKIYSISNLEFNWGNSTSKYLDNSSQILKSANFFKQLENVTKDSNQYILYNI